MLQEMLQRGKRQKDELPANVRNTDNNLAESNKIVLTPIALNDIV